MASTWNDLLDPNPSDLSRYLPGSIVGMTRDRIGATPQHDDDPRPRLESHGDYLFAVLVVPNLADRDAEVIYQEVDVVVTADRLLSVRKTPPVGNAFAYEAGEVTTVTDIEPGIALYQLFNLVAERYLALVDTIDDDIDQLEDAVEQWDPQQVRERISELRHDILHTRRVLAPMRDITRSVVDNRVELDGRHKVFSRPAQIHFADAYDKFLRATDGLDQCRDLLSGVRDYHQAAVSNSQNEVMKRLTVIASVLLLPTFIVGLYGQNLRGIPEYHFHYGYLWSWLLIVLTTIAQVVWFKRKRWI